MAWGIGGDQVKIGRLEFIDHDLGRIGASVVAGMLLVTSAAAQTDGSTNTAEGAECENYDPDWSPDGRSLAFVRSCEGNADLHLVDADGTNLVRLTETPGREGAPAWSPDGTRLAYHYTAEEADLLEHSGLQRAVARDARDTQFHRITPTNAAHYER